VVLTHLVPSPSPAHQVHVSLNTACVQASHPLFFSIRRANGAHSLGAKSMCPARSSSPRLPQHSLCTSASSTVLFHQESKWCALTFPEESRLLVPRLLMETMAAISSSFTARLEAAATEAGATAGGADLHPSAGGNTPTENKGASKLGTLLSLHGMTGAFARNVQHVLAAADGEELGKVLRAVYSPFEGHKARWVAALRSCNVSSRCNLLISGLNDPD
jgi:hypothetical protein